MQEAPERALPPPLSRREAQMHGCCQRCRHPGPRLVGLRRWADASDYWSRLLLCDRCIGEASAEGRWNLMVGQPSGPEIP